MMNVSPTKPQYNDQTPQVASIIDDMNGNESGSPI